MLLVLSLWVVLCIQCDVNSSWYRTVIPGASQYSRVPSSPSRRAKRMSTRNEMPSVFQQFLFTESEQMEGRRNGQEVRKGRKEGRERGVEETRIDS